MVLVVASGFYGVFVYLRVPAPSPGTSATRRCSRCCCAWRTSTRTCARRRCRCRTIFSACRALGGGDAPGRQRLSHPLGARPGLPDRERGARAARARQALTGEPANVNKEVYTLLLEKNELLARVRRDMRHKAILDLWLYSMCAVGRAARRVAVHVTTVFIYW